VERRPFGALGFAAEPRAASETLGGFALGGGLLGASVLLLSVAGSARWVADAGTVPEYAASLAGALAIFAVAAAAEEVLFRGYPFQALVQGIGVWPAVVVSSAVFAVGHGRNPNVTWLGLMNIFIAGIMLAVAYLRTRSLWFATALHLAWNWVMSALLDFPVSGLQRDTPLYSARELGADWWTGGAFGPEAGLAATLAIVGGTLWMLRTPRLSESPRMRELRPLVDDRLGARWNGAR
jgi:membrane protease YdiL (CAAX protease family)